MSSRTTPVRPDSLDIGSLALFVGYAASEQVLRALASGGFSEVRFSHGFVFQHLLDGERTIGELADRMNVTQQAASKVVAELEAMELVERVSDASDARIRRVRLAVRGLGAVNAARKARAALQRQLETKLGVARLRGARRTLAEALELLGGVEAIETRRIIAPR